MRINHKIKDQLNEYKANMDTIQEVGSQVIVNALKHYLNHLDNSSDELDEYQRYDQYDSLGLIAMIEQSEGVFVGMNSEIVDNWNSMEHRIDYPEYTTPIIKLK